MTVAHLHEVCRKPVLLFAAEVSAPPVGVRLGHVADDIAPHEDQLVSLLGRVVVAGLECGKETLISNGGSTPFLRGHSTWDKPKRNAVAQPVEQPEKCPLRRCNPHRHEFYTYGGRKYPRLLLSVWRNIGISDRDLGKSRIKETRQQAWNLNLKTRKRKSSKHFEPSTRPARWQRNIVLHKLLVWKVIFSSSSSLRVLCSDFHKVPIFNPRNTNLIWVFSPELWAGRRMNSGPCIPKRRRHPPPHWPRWGHASRTSPRSRDTSDKSVQKDGGHWYFYLEIGSIEVEDVKSKVKENIPC